MATLFSRNCIKIIRYTPAIQIAECCKSTSACIKMTFRINIIILGIYVVKINKK
ncbi:hypothetical protein HanRHA438_Chr11g0506581 [Helianthus annuus]|nr:hypothetical protein HanRHA438_Chr11g0506581 [Helianthus annuus]